VLKLSKLLLIFEIFNRKSAPIEPVIRPKGLGLGADISLNSRNSDKPSQSSNNDNTEELILAKGSYVFIEYGSHKNSYGKVEGFDDEMSRATVKLSINKEYVDIPVAVLRAVSKKEYQTESRVINKSKYDEYKYQLSKRDRS
jgi:G patch domain and KOW motifs-containing protein